MPEQDLIDVRVLVDGQPLQEYREPEATDEGPDRVRYVEVKAGQEFGIQITWKAGFDLKWTDALAYRLYVDDHNFFSYGAKEKRSIPHRRGTLVNDVLQVDESISFKNDVTGEWGICAYAFGVLGMTDDAPIDPCLKQGDIQELGCIRVKICRANKVKLDEPYCWQGQRPKTLDEIFENSLKGRALKNNVKFPNGVRIEDGPEAQLIEYQPMPSLEGTVYTFRFLYRTRKILQSLGCIPRSPSPSPDRQLALERAENTIRLEKQRAREANIKILRLREELTRAQSGSRQTSILTDSDPFAPVTNRGDSTTGDTTIRHSPNIKGELTRPRLLEARIMRPQPPLSTSDGLAQKRAKAEGEEVSTEAGRERARGDLSLAAEVEEILRSVELQDNDRGRGSRSSAENKRKRPVDDDDEVVELPPTKKKTFEIVGLTDD